MRISAMKERLGLGLAKLMLRLTRNRALADACSVLPLIPRRQFAIAVQPGTSRCLAFYQEDCGLCGVFLGSRLDTQDLTNNASFN